MSEVPKVFCFSFIYLDTLQMCFGNYYIKLSLIKNKAKQNLINNKKNPVIKGKFTFLLKKLCFVFNTVR